MSKLLLQDLAFAPYGPRWRVMRKLCAVHLFSPKALDNLCSVRAMEATALGRALYARARAGSAVNLGQVLYKCTTNAISMTMLGRRVFEKEESNEAVEFKEMVLESMKLSGVFNVGDFVPALRWLDPQRLIGKLKKLHRRFDSFLDKVIEEHRLAAGTEEEEGGDLLSVLMRLKEDVDDDGGKITNTNIKALLFVSLVAFSPPLLLSNRVFSVYISQCFKHEKNVPQPSVERDSLRCHFNMVANLLQHDRSSL